jgi:flagellar hook assembly protein FlgD
VLNPFTLDQNWPNPFNPSTNISFTLLKADIVQLTIYNMLGEKIRTVVNGEQNAGKHTFIWNGKNNTGTSVVSGTYIYHLNVGQISESKQMVLIR